MIKNITNVRGIKSWGAHIGIKSMRRDLAIIYSEVPANAAAVFTQNQIVAEPIKVSRRNIQDGRAQVIVCNAGNANACTGEQGRKGAEAMVEAAAEALNIDKELVIIASTGLIGAPFPTEDVVTGIKTNVEKLSNNSKAGSFAANAILTTDTFPKEGFSEFDLKGYEVNMAGISKGSGMIHPNMATMLGFIVTDAAISAPLLQKCVSECVNDSFNMITVDGDTSTNDMVAVLANGLAGNDEITDENDPAYTIFKQELQDMMVHLAKLIISDGEGASKFVEYHVRGAKTKEDARQMARAISDSTLVKAAMFGRDPNWGRIICAGGNSGVPFEFEKTDLKVGVPEDGGPEASTEGISNSRQAVTVLSQGQPQEFDRSFVKRMLRESHIMVDLNLNQGDAHAVAFGADLTTDYVMFNSVYTT